MKQRIEWIDLAKGLSIILVVYGHSGLSSIPVVGPFFSAFRMPFFFMCSGILFKPEKYPSFFSFVKRRWSTLIRPFFIFSLTILALEAIIQPDYWGFVRNTLVNGWGGYALWFIPVLVLTEMLYWCLYKIGGRKTIIFILLLLCAAIGFISSRYSWRNPYNIWFVFTSVLFYGIGNLTGKELVRFFENSPVSYAILMGLLMLLLAFSFLLSSGKTEFFINRIADVFTYSSAIGGSLFMCVGAYLLSLMRGRFFRLAKDVIKFLGRNSYVVLAFHQIILLLLAHFFSLPGILSRIIMWVILTFLIYLINSCLPMVLGRDSQ